MLGFVPEMGDSTIRFDGRRVARRLDNGPVLTTRDGDDHDADVLRLESEDGEAGAYPQSSPRVRRQSADDLTVHHYRHAPRQVDETTRSPAHLQERSDSGRYEGDDETIGSRVRHMRVEFRQPLRVQSVVSGDLCPLREITGCEKSVGPPSALPISSDQRVGQVASSSVRTVARCQNRLHAANPFDRWRFQWNDDRRERAAVLRGGHTRAPEGGPTVPSDYRISPADVQRGENTPPAQLQNRALRCAIADSDVRADEQSQRCARQVPRGQHNGQGVHQSHGRSEDSPLSHPAAVLGPVAPAAHQDYNGVPLGPHHDSLGSRRLVTSNRHDERCRVDTSSASVAVPIITPAADAGFVCSDAQQAVADVLGEVPVPGSRTGGRADAVVDAAPGSFMGVSALYTGGESDSEDEGNHWADGSFLGSSIGAAKLVARTAELARRLAGASTSDVMVPGAPLLRIIGVEKAALAPQGLVHVGRNFIALCLQARGLSASATKAVHSSWAPTTIERYDAAFSKYTGYAHSRAHSVLLASDLHVAEYLSSLIGKISGKSVAGASTAICRHYEIGLGRKFADSELIKAVIHTAKIAKPYEPKYDDCYAFVLCDNYLFKLTPNVTTRSEGSLLSAASHLMQRFSWGRGSEWRSFNRDRVKLYTEQSTDPTATDSFENATRMVLTLLGTKNGKGLQKESPPITIHRVRQGVVGDEAARALDVFAVLGELERRYEGRDVGPRLDSRYAKASADEHARCGDGFFLSTKPEKTTGIDPLVCAKRTPPTTQRS